MPYVSSTPEVLAARLIGRADSRNPATTCRGISISTGKPCRRSIAAKAPKGYKAPPVKEGEEEEGSNPAEEFFCFQHKDQAKDTVVLHRSESQRLRRLQGRTSLDTLVEVMLGPDAEDGGSAGGAAIGPDQAEVIIRRETLLNNDEVMVVRQNTVVKKDAKIVKDAVRRGGGKKAVWDALHGQQQQQQPLSYENTSQVPLSAFPVPPSASARPSGAAQAHGMGYANGTARPPNNQFMPPPPRPPAATVSRPKKRPSVLAQIFCCIEAEEEDYTTPPRPQQPQMQNARPRPPMQQSTAPYPSNFKQYNQAPPSAQRPPLDTSSAMKHQSQVQPVYPHNIHEHSGWDRPLQSGAEPDLSSESDSDYENDTETVVVPDVQLISPTLPSHLSAKTRALITTEMNKPISQKDMPGYIYIFLLKDDISAPPPASTTLAPTTATKRRNNSYTKTDPASAALFRAVEDDDDDDDDAGRPVSPGGACSVKPEKRVLLKIGRAQNVQRRLHQWSQQCGYNLQLLRFYPHVPIVDPASPMTSNPGAAGGRKDSAAEISSTPGQKVAFAHRVERLIHLELRDEYYNKPHVCGKCQRVHKEWFAVPGNREGVRRVDEVIKRWCKWADGVEGAVKSREQGHGSGLWHRRGESWSSAFGGAGEPEKDDRRATGGVRGVERPVWREGYQEQVVIGEADEGQQTRMERMGTFGFL
ncbi:hypothetical protein Dda_0132 [Drechslerella dactyloides]|uniref:Bacteriophage T5 Orf172 DNA-binding domain-containing protein n=1 Tax=Drechslerella dactyloides TaxID=74499 RepID=A0AAD6NNY9_DREDA|nr:hypothetical protein Dda_0132 [Drechslerella dactyloides]